LIRFVDSAPALEALCRDLVGHPWLALDTEFLREDTYYPRLCLLQVAAPEITACVDPLAIPRLDPLLDILFDPGVTKVVHACYQDMEIFFHLRGRPPGPIFDTQIAAPLLGLPYQASYATLVKETLGVSLQKGHARTDWRRRPLSDEQLQYAIDDVRYLGPMYLQLQARLTRLGRAEWLIDDFAAAIEPARYRNSPGDAWRRVRGIRRLSGTARRIARALAEWREAVAISDDRPRGWILRDDALLDLARFAPTEEAQLPRLHSLRRQTIARHGGEILAVIDRALRKGSDTETPEEPPAVRLTASQEEVLDAMMAIIRHRAAECEIHPNALASRADLIDLMHGRGDSPLLRGWRRNIVGLELLRMMEEERKCSSP
jgi:ribonuclease D